MPSKEEIIQNAIVAFRKIHGGHDRKRIIRGVDRGELNLNNMECVHLKKGGWVCTLPHVHLPLMTMVYEFVYKTEGDRRPQYSCECISNSTE